MFFLSIIPEQDKVRELAIFRFDVIIILREFIFDAGHIRNILAQGLKQTHAQSIPGFSHAVRHSHPTHKLQNEKQPCT